MSALCLALVACQDSPPPAPARGSAEEVAAKAETETEAQLPAPPIVEDFEGKPKLSLFPRIGDYRPENDDEAGLPFWNAYLEHVTRTAGLVNLPAGGRAFGMRSVAGLDSLGFFSPLAVSPSTTYEVSARFKTELPEGGQAGVGVVEFDQFLWVGEQYTRSLAAKHQTGIHEGIKLAAVNDWEPRDFSFTTGPKTRMIHLVFYREGESDRKPVLWDDVEIKALGK